MGSVLGIGDFDEVKRRSILVAIDTFRCRLMDLSALIDARRAMGRPQDVAAVQELETIKEKLENE